MVMDIQVIKVIIIIGLTTHIILVIGVIMTGIQHPVTEKQALVVQGFLKKV